MRASCIFMLSATAIACTAFVAACFDPAQPVDPIGPDRAQFPPVALMLVRRCGEVDCHGSKYRNFRVYGYGSQRLDPNDRPDTPQTVTPAEADAVYEGIIALEPEIMRQVVRANGANPERLTLVRKGRGSEDHKGKSLFAPGDDGDKCLTSWLASTTDTAACDRAVKAP